MKSINTLFITHSSQYYGASKSLLLLIKYLPNYVNACVFLNSRGPLLEKLNENHISYYCYPAFQNRMSNNILKPKVFLREIYNRTIYIKTLLRLSVILILLFMIGAIIYNFNDKGYCETIPIRVLILLGIIYLSKRICK